MPIHRRRPVAVQRVSHTQRRHWHSREAMCCRCAQHQWQLMVLMIPNDLHHFCSYATQRDCEVEVDSVDKVGTFLGILRMGKLNLG